MQSFNALVLAMIMIILKGGTVHWWYYQASLFAIASLNSWFMGIFGLHNTVSDIAGKVHEQGNQAFNEAKKNVGNAVAFAGMAAGGLQNSGIMSGGSSGGVPGGVAGGSAGGGPASGGGTGDTGKGGNIGTQTAKNENKDNKNFKTEIVGDNIKVTKANASSADSGKADGKQNSSPDQSGTNAENNPQDSNSDNNGQSGSMSNQTPQKDDKISQEGNSNMSLGQKVKKTASVFAAAAAATYSRNDYIKQGAAEYLGYDKGMDKKGEEGYFGYQPFGTANNNISKESQQKKRAEEVAKKKEEEEKQEREQREMSEKIDMILEFEQENQQNNSGSSYKM